MHYLAVIVKISVAFKRIEMQVGVMLQCEADPPSPTALLAF